MSDPLATKGYVDRETIARIYNDDLEIAARLLGDTRLSAFIGTVMTGSQVDAGAPTYGTTPVTVVAGTSLRAAIIALDVGKNRKMGWMNNANTVIVTDAVQVKFGPLFTLTTPLVDQVYITISGSIVHNLASSIESIFVAGGDGIQYFTGNRFCIGISATNRLIGSIAAVYSVIGSIYLYGRQGSIE